MSLFDDENDLIDEDDAPAAAPEEGAAGLLPPREMADCFGHEAIEQQFLTLYNAGRLPHAVIFAGPEGIGKATLAFRLARFLLKYGKNEADSGGLFGAALPAAKPESLHVASGDNIFRQVAAGGHPDLLTIERPFDEKKGKFKDSIPVEEARKIAPFLRLTPAMGGWRIVIVNDADTMNRNGQNAILKILEEPPASALLILICHRAGAMLPTIRSRCRTIMFTPPAPEIFDGLLRRDNPDVDQRDLETLYTMTGASVGQGLRILREGGIETVGKLAVLLNDWPRWDWPQIHGLADSLARQEDSFRTFTEIFQWTANAILRARATGQALPAVLNSSAVAKIMNNYNLAEWNQICENLRDHFATSDHADLDKRQAVLGAFMAFGVKEAA